MAYGTMKRTANKLRAKLKGGKGGGGMATPVQPHNKAGFVTNTQSNKGSRYGKTC